MSDEGFHEIQLNGKQLVFLFMAATVVSVVIFLCGVMVGRGVKQATVATNEFAPTAPVADTSRSGSSAPASDPASAPANPAPQASTPPPEPAEDGSDYYKQLTDAEPGAAAKVAPPTPAERRTAANPAPVDRPAKPAPERVSAASPAAVAAGGFVVQIAALRDRTEADTIVKRLAGKGYQAFVVNPVPGKPPVYKVQVGRFAERGEAEKIAVRLKSEEQYSPWVTR
jgi:cell division protein FtsN